MIHKNIQKTIFDKEQIKNYKYLLLETALIAEQCYGDDKDHLAYVSLDLGEDEHIQYDSIYIGKQFCHKIIIKKGSLKSVNNLKIPCFTLQVVLEDLYNYDLCQEILYNIYILINYDLSIRSYNKHRGLPNIKPNFLFKMYYGTAPEAFSIEFLIGRGSFESTTKTLHYPKDIDFSKNKVDIRYIKRYVEATMFNDPIAKFAMLFGFFELIYDSAKFNEIDKAFKKKSKDFILLETLHFWGITEIKNGKNPEEIVQIAESNLTEVREKRNSLFHDSDTTNLHSILYNLLLPITSEIVETSRKHPNIFK